MKTKTAESKITGARERAEIYRFFSSIFLTPPTAAVLDKFSDENFISELSNGFSEEVSASLHKIASDADANRVYQDFMNLFKVPLGYYIPPYESVHREERVVNGERRRLLMGASAISAERYYKFAGAEISKEFEELPDHIGVELGFMAFLCEQEWEKIQSGQLEEAKKYREYQAAFLCDHLLKWTSEFCRKVKANSTSGFYGALARLVDEFIECEEKTIAGNYS
ncbi:MAG: hypothetical protein Kow0090_12710 [Myxococcota bacterium]